MMTTTLEAAFAILAIEFALLAPLAVFFALSGARKVEAATTSEATELVAKVADTEDARRSALGTVFREKYQYEGDDIDRAVEEFMEREKAFYNAVVGAVLGRGDSKISDINDELTKVVAPWISLTPKNMVDAKSAAAVATEKDRIEIELGQTKDTLEKMIAEYNRAFMRANEQQAAAEKAAADPETGAGESAGEQDLPAEAAPEESAAAETGDDPDELDELDYKTEELNDLDDVLAAIEAKQSGGEDADPAAEAAATAPEASGDSIVNLDEDDGGLADVDAEFAGEVADALVDEADSIEELDALEELDEDAGDDARRERADKPMTADDLDELMESLDADGVDEPESA